MWLFFGAVYDSVQVISVRRPDMSGNICLDSTVITVWGINVL